MKNFNIHHSIFNIQYLFFEFIFALAAAALLRLPAAAHPFDQSYESAVDALAAYRTLVKDYPEDLELRYLLGTMLIMAKELDEAERTFNYVLEKKPDYDMAWYKLAEVCYRRKEYERALAPLSKMKDKSLQDDRLIAEATVWLRLNKPKKTLEAANKAVKIDELNPGGWLHIGLAEYELGRRDRGIEMLLKSLKMDPSQPLVYDWFLDMIRKHRDKQRQMKILKDLYESIPYDSPAARRVTMDILALKKEFENSAGEQKK